MHQQSDKACQKAHGYSPVQRIVNLTEHDYPLFKDSPQYEQEGDQPHQPRLYQNPRELGIEKTIPCYAKTDKWVSGKIPKLLLQASCLQKYHRPG